MPDGAIDEIRSKEEGKTIVKDYYSDAMPLHLAIYKAWGGEAGIDPNIALSYPFTERGMDADNLAKEFFWNDTDHNRARKTHDSRCHPGDFDCLVIIDSNSSTRY